VARGCCTVCSCCCHMARILLLCIDSTDLTYRRCRYVLSKRFSDKSSLASTPESSRLVLCSSSRKWRGSERSAWCLFQLYCRHAVEGPIVLEELR
jgi:hypothetical protein